MNGKPAVLLIVFRQPGANIIDTVIASAPRCPRSKASIPAAIDLTMVLDRTTTIRASVHDVELTLLISIVLVILVVFVFLRNAARHVHSQRGRAGVADRHVRRDVPVRLQHRQSVADGADHLHRLRRGRRHRGDRKHHPLSRSRACAPCRRRCKGAQEIGFTVLSISISLVAVFIPILLMGGIVGRLFREFAVTLSVAIAVSLAGLAHHHAHDVSRASEARSGRGPRPAVSRQRASASTGSRSSTSARLRGCCDHSAVTLAILLMTVALNVYLFVDRAQGFFPAAGHRPYARRIIQADQDISFQAMEQLHRSSSSNIVKADPGGRERDGLHRRRRWTTNTGRMFIALKPLDERKVSADQVIDRLRPKLAAIPGATLYLASRCRICASAAGRATRNINTRCRATIWTDLNQWGPLLLQQMKKLPELDRRQYRPAE